LKKNYQITRSEFDSNLLSKEVAKVSLTTPDAENFKNLINDLEQTKFEIIMVKSPFTALSKLTELPWKNTNYLLALSDIKLDFAFNSNKLQQSDTVWSDYKFSTEFSPFDIEQFKFISRQIGIVSRFAEEFGTPVAIKLYDQWIENLVKKETIFTARAKTGEVAALVATTKSESNIDLALVAAHPAHSGKGLTKALLSFATLELSKQKMQITVSARVNNQTAIRLYEGTGFRNNNIRMDWTLTRIS